jgi:hypothetical protein
VVHRIGAWERLDLCTGGGAAASIAACSSSGIKPRKGHNRA